MTASPYPQLRAAMNGISGILVTPFDAQDQLAPRNLAPIIGRAVDAGVHCLVVNGNTSEFYGLTPEEAVTMAHAATEQVGGRVPVLAGIKWASPTPLVMAEAMRRTADLDLAWVCGLAEIWAPPLYAMGARGFTSGLINVRPAHSVAIHQALEAGDYPRARLLIGQMRDFESLRAEEQNGCNVSVVKAALRLMGQDCGAPRPPAAWPLTDAAMQTLKALLRSWHG
ncbi:dihydrodipicolinate synthase family protein [Achromobacter anxifer]|uniref:dihydrodipicolinate synthase family protein n=1 Tax=Achromobacter anxifer TaxID=1287737 RepID=UPI002157C2AB|nr:dihydrodipicolinate synthase family protein [Achromobacter anxifer]